MKNIRVDLSQGEMPTQWYNIVPDLEKYFGEPFPPPRGDKQLQFMAERALSKECLAQEMNRKDSWIDIPEEVLEKFILMGRPRPLYRVRPIEKYYDLPEGIKLFCKAEFYGGTTGSHKANTAIAQAYYAKKEGKRRIVTETGAGQWGTAVAYAAAQVSDPKDPMEVTIYWVRSVYDWKEGRLTFMEIYIGNSHKDKKVGIFASPSNNTSFGRKILKTNPKHPGSLSIAISEGMEDVKNDENAVYALGSVLNLVLLHQTIIGLETRLQLKKIGEFPTKIISCVGGGSNYGGIAIPFAGLDVLREGRDIDFVVAQTEVTPSLRDGKYKYDYCDHAHYTPQVMAYTLGSDIQPEPIKADGLRYHLAAPILSYLRHKGMIKKENIWVYPKDERIVIEAGALFIRLMGFPLAPESTYSFRAAIDEALKAKREGRKETILFEASGHGYMDMDAYRAVLARSEKTSLWI